VNLATGKARVILESPVSDAALGESIAAAGYSADFSGEADPPQIARRERNEVILSAMLSAPLLHPFSPPFRLQAVLAGLVLAFFGRRFYTGAWHALKRRTGNMDLLIAVGSTAAFILSFLGRHPYFESAASVITLVKLGKWLELRAKAKTTRNLRALESLRPATARVILGSRSFEMPVSGVKVGDRIEVLPGDRVPLDGIILEGESETDESFLTGESALLFKKAGDRVIGGSINASGRLVVKVSALMSGTLLSRVVRMIEDANSKKAPIERLVDRVAAVFVPVVFAIAVGAGALTAYFSGGLTDEAWLRAISVLVIACPCALGLATPTAIMVGTGLAARFGILIRDVGALESARAMTTLVLDKTGTLTEGKPSMVSIVCAEGIDEAGALAIAGALQAGSTHPLAHAVQVEVKNRGLEVPAAEAIRALPGTGVSGVIRGKDYRLGSFRILEQLGIAVPPPSKSNDTVSYLVDAGERRVAAVFGFSDPLKARAGAFVKALQREGLKVVILSGDRTPVVEEAARRLGVADFRGELLPADKVAEIEKLKKEGECVGMLGDGINDAPALAAADVGITLSTGTDVAMQTAGITLMGPDPLRTLDAIRISKKTGARIRQNLVWAFLYNVICIPLAASGKLDPMMAGAAMALSSVSVVVSSLLLERQFGPPSAER